MAPYIHDKLLVPLVEVALEYGERTLLIMSTPQ